MSDDTGPFLTEIGMAKEIERLRADVRDLRVALEELEDWQNGPPLVTYTEGWTAAMKQARAVLERTAPREPTPSPAGAPDEDDGSMDCSCGRVTLDFFTKEHSKLTKEGERFISTNHRRDRCDREEVVPSPAFPLCPEHSIRLPCPACLPAAPRCERCGGTHPAHLCPLRPPDCWRCDGMGWVKVDDEDVVGAACPACATREAP